MSLGLPASGGSNGPASSPSSAKQSHRGEPKPKRFKLDFRSRRVLAEPVTEDTVTELQRHFEVSCSRGFEMCIVCRILLTGSHGLECAPQSQKYGTVRSLGPKEDTSTFSFEFETREAAEQVRGLVSRAARVATFVPLGVDLLARPLCRPSRQVHRRCTERKSSSGGTRPPARVRQRRLNQGRLDIALQSTGERV